MSRYAMLSGIGIADAVARHREYLRLQARADNACSRLERWMWELRAKRLKAKPRIHIDNFDKMPSHCGGQLNPNSYNLTLSPDLLVYDTPRTPAEPGPMFDWDVHALDMRKNNPTHVLRISTEDGLLLRPGRVYLGKTVEYTETYNLVPVLDGRSSIGRLGMAVHITAGFGDNHWKGHWTMEIFVVQPLRIYAYVQIAQVRYHRVGHGDPYVGKYLNVKGTPPEASKIWKEFDVK